MKLKCEVIIVHNISNKSKVIFNFEEYVVRERIAAVLVMWFTVRTPTQS